MGEICRSEYSKNYFEYLSADGVFLDGSYANITIRYYGKMDQLAKFNLANISNFTVYIHCFTPNMFHPVGKVLLRCLMYSSP